MDSAPIATVAALIGDPARALMLTALMDGRARTASELAAEAGISRPTASAHLSKLTQGKLLAVVSQGRHRYFQLQSPEIATALEALMVVGDRSPNRVNRPQSPERKARSCYDHLAGRLGVEIFESLSANNHLQFKASEFVLTPSGEALMSRIGIPLNAVRQRRRSFVLACLDWSERRYHLGGALGAAILTFGLEEGWLHRAPNSRALNVSVSGRRAFRNSFDVHVA